MRNLFTFTAGASVLVLFFSCQPAKQDPSAGKPLVLGSRTLQKTIGTDCNKPDSLRTDCAQIDFAVPAVQSAGAQSPLSKNLNVWTDQFLIHLLIWSDYPEINATKALSSIEAAVNRFEAMHRDAAGSVSAGLFAATCTNRVLLNDGKYLTIRLDGHSFEGGNRALNEAAIATFDCASGKKLNWDDLVQDKPALLPLAEAKIRETRADAFKEGFEFSQADPVVLPESYGLTARGLVLHYQSDEILRLGGATEFVLPFEELGTNLKLTTPMPTTADDAEDLFTVQADSVVIPTVEIEVRTSARAKKTLRNKKETIIVAAYFSGEPLDEKHRGEDGLMEILQTERELSGDKRVARFENVKMSSAIYNKLKNKNIELLINVYSGRKSSKDNLLSCSVLSLKARQFGNKRFSLGCSMIEESLNGQTPPIACFALPDAGAATTGTPGFLVECNEAGDMAWAGEPLRDYDDLKTKLRPVLKEWIQNGAKTLPDLDVRGCLMGSKGELRTAYEELKTELLKGPKTPAPKSAAGSNTPSSTKVATRSTKPKVPSITVRRNGEMTLNGKKVETFEDLRKQLQQVLLGYAVIPADIPVQSIGEVGMGTRAEIRTEVAAALAGAQWIRKKTALATLAVPVGKKLGVAVQLEVNDYQKNGAFAFVDARPKQTNGKTVDYSQTTYRQDHLSGKFDDRVFGLLQYKNGAWNVLIYTIGAHTIPADIWAKKYKAPRALFRRYNG